MAENSAPDCTHWSKVHCWHERTASVAAGWFAHNACLNLLERG